MLKFQKVFIRIYRLSFDKVKLYFVFCNKENLIGVVLRHAKKNSIKRRTLFFLITRITIIRWNIARTICPVLDQIEAIIKPDFFFCFLGH